MNDNARLEMLERTIMELGADIISLKGSMNKYRKNQDQMLQVFKGLKQILDEKGLVTMDDFDAAIEIGEVLEHFNTSLDPNHASAQTAKKAGH